MKYTLEIEINKQIDKVIDLFSNSDNFYKWMEGLQSIEHLEGERGKPGAKSKMVFNIEGKEQEILETIISRDLPQEYSSIFDSEGVHNIQKNRFEKVNDNKTKLIAKNEFQFDEAMKSMTDLFKQQSMTYLENFKRFAENN